MTTYVYRPEHPEADENGMVDKSLLYSSPGLGLYVISDTMDPTRHMATGRYFTSKSKFRAETKASGCFEIGNDPALYRQRKPAVLSREKRRDDIRRTIYDLKNGRNGHG